MAIQAVFDALESALAAVGVEVMKGPERLGDNAGPPHITLVPGEESFSGPAPRFVGPPRVLHTRSVTIAAYIWGKDWDSTEQLIGTFLYCLRAIVGKSYEIVSGKWTQQNNAAVVQYGRYYALEFRLLVPVVVPDGAEGIAPVTNTDTTDTTLPFDGTVLAP